MLRSPSQPSLNRGGGAESPRFIVETELGVVAVERESDEYFVRATDNAGDDRWRSELPQRSLPLRLGLAPDVNDDGWPDVRAGFIARDVIEPVTWILSGSNGELLYRIRASAPFDPWFDDGATEQPIDVGGFARERSGWRQLDSEFLPSNVLRGEPIEFNGMPRALSRRSPKHEREMREPQLSPPSQPTDGPPNPTSVKLKRVRFLGSYGVHTDRIPPGFLSPRLYNPYWLDSNLDGDANDWPPSGTDERAPILYRAGDTIRVDEVVIAVSPPFSVTLANASVRGHTTTLNTFVSAGLSYNGAGTEITATISGSVPSTASTIARLANWPVSWELQITHTSGTTIYPVGTSQNHVHFVLQAPTGGFTIQYSMLDIACRRAAGLTTSSTHQQIADAIFQEFDLTVVRAQDVLEGVSTPTLTYYADWTNLNDSVTALLATTDSQCAAWAQFFMRCLHTAGIDPPNEWVDIRYNTVPIVPAEAVFLVNNWTPGAESNPTPLAADYPAIDIPDLPAFVTTSSYLWIFNDFTDATGVSGEGPVADPASIFSRHFMILVYGKYYDPSYSTTWGSLSAFDSGGIAGYGLLFWTHAWVAIRETDLNVDLSWPRDGIVSSSYVPTPALMIRENDSGVNELIEEISNKSR